MSKDSISKEFIERWESFYGKERANIIVTNLRKLDPRIIFPNSLKIDLSTLKNQLEDKNFKFTYIKEFNGLIVEDEPFSIVSTPEYLGGLFSIQALTSIFPPKILKPSQDSVILDMTASPGIKTCLLAQEMKNQGLIIAIEKSKSRLSALKANIARMGISNTIMLNFDATNLYKLNIQVDHVLLDAPCSGTGLKMSKNKRLEPKTLNDIFRHAKQQETLLEIAWKLLKPRGTLIYSTCSLEPEEGEKQILDFLLNHEHEATLLPLSITSGISGEDTKWDNSVHPQLKETRRILPKIGFDGFFIALLQKRLH
ncbi:MAG: RsmB/NOP family class I SAM-dependent RNA methyltransferase [Candidatus Hodarchaeota archaeon]